MPSAVAEARAFVDTYRAKPVSFVRDVLGGEPWETPRAILRALARPHASVAVKSCHGSGKTWTAAQAALWWAGTGGKVITTAPTWTQVEKLLWGEIGRAYEASRIPFGAKLNTTELQLPTGAFAIGLSTNKGVRFQGWHGERVLVILDEAPGVLPEIWEAIEGVRASGDVRLLAIGNPIVPSGPFYDAFTKDRDAWTTFTISAFDTPNLRGLTPKSLLALSDEELDKSVCSYLVSRRWVRDRLIRWGDGFILYRSRVLGEFPPQAADALITLAWLEAARVRELEPADEDPLEAGIDVAGPGDAESVLALRRGPKLEPLQCWREDDVRGHVARALLPFKDQLEAVRVDSVGIGYHVATHLQDLGFPVVFVNVGESPSSDDLKERFTNLKAELYWGLRERAEEGRLSGLEDDTAIGQLADVRWKPTAGGKVRIETKEEARQRGAKSPDRAEAIMLAFAASAMQAPAGAPAGSTVPPSARFQSKRWGAPVMRRR